MRNDRRRGSGLAIALLVLSVVALVRAEEGTPAKRCVPRDCGLGVSVADRGSDEFRRVESPFRPLASPPTSTRGENYLREVQLTFQAVMGLLLVYYLGRSRLISILCIVWFLSIIALSALHVWSALSRPRSDPSFAHQLGRAEAKAFTQTAIAAFGIVVGVRKMMAPPEESPLEHANRIARTRRAEARALRLGVEGARPVPNPSWEAVQTALRQVGHEEPSHVTLFAAADEFLEAAGVPSRLFLVCRRRSGDAWTYWSLGREGSAPGLDTSRAPLTLEDALVVFQGFFERDRIPPGFALRAAADGPAL